MVRIAVCEDETVFLERLTGQIRAILDKYSFAYRIDAFANGTALLAREAYDILLLDIEMKPYNGIALAKKLRERGDSGRIIFITAYEQYAIEAYDVQAFHYLVKPVNGERLEEVLLKCHASLKEEKEQAVTVRNGAAVRRIPFGEVLYLEVLDRKIYLHTAEETISFYGKLEELASALPDNFFQCHRSYIVNFHHVQRYEKGDIRLDNEECIPLSKRKYGLFGQAFMQYLKESGDVF